MWASVLRIWRERIRRDSCLLKYLFSLHLVLKLYRMQKWSLVLALSYLTWVLIWETQCTHKYFKKKIAMRSQNVPLGFGKNKQRGSRERKGGSAVPACLGLVSRLLALWIRTEGFTCTLCSNETLDFGEKPSWMLLIRLLNGAKCTFWFHFDPETSCLRMTRTWSFKKKILANRVCSVLPKIEKKRKGYQAFHMGELGWEKCIWRDF